MVTDEGWEIILYFLYLRFLLKREYKQIRNTEPIFSSKIPGEISVKEP